MYLSKEFLGYIWISTHEVEFLGNIIPVGTKFTFEGNVNGKYSYVC